MDSLRAHPLALEKCYLPLSEGLLPDGLPKLTTQPPVAILSSSVLAATLEAHSAELSNVSALLCFSALHLQWQLGPGGS